MSWGLTGAYVPYHPTDGSEWTLGHSQSDRQMPTLTVGFLGLETDRRKRVLLIQDGDQSVCGTVCDAARATKRWDLLHLCGHFLLDLCSVTPK